jgi:hypothetical protein
MDYRDSLQSTEMYKKAVKNLNKIAGVDTREIKTLKDLSFVVRFVSKGMQTLLSVHGQENKNGAEDSTNINRFYFIDRKSDEKKLYTSVTSQHAYFGLTGEYNIKIPLNKDLTIWEEVKEDVEYDEDRSSSIESCDVVAEDYRTKPFKKIYPTMQPISTGTIQGYADIMKLAVNEFLLLTEVVCQELCTNSASGCLVDGAGMVSLLKCKLRMTA